MNVKIQVELIARLRNLESLMGPATRSELHEAMGKGVRDKTSEHLQKVALEKHNTANRLGADPSGFYADAYRAVGDPESDSSGATITISHIGLARAFQDVTITPVAAKALTIPVDALAYNRRPGQFARNELFVWKSKTTGNAFLALRQENKGDPLQLMYLLVRSVTQKQDRSLLPSDEEWNDAAAEAATVWFDRERDALSAT